MEERRRSKAGILIPLLPFEASRVVTAVTPSHGAIHNECVRFLDVTTLTTVTTFTLVHSLHVCACEIDRLDLSLISYNFTYYFCIDISNILISME